MKNKFDAIVVGAGHAGVEAALALARTGFSTLVLTLSLDSISYLACNPSIGGTGKGHLVREIDALGGQMGVTADATYLQLKMLNKGKGNAVQSLRAQSDKILYHLFMKKTLETEKNITLLQSEVSELVIKNKKVKGVKTTFGTTFYSDVVVLSTGVYLNSSIIMGDLIKKTGPSGFQGATLLTDSLRKHGFPLRRFKTGTPARVKKSSIDFSKFVVSYGDEIIYGFSFLNTEPIINKNVPCYIGHTNKKTKEIAQKNIHLSPLYNGQIKGTSARYCPSFEDRVMRFPEKDSHQLFLEPETSFSDEYYVQGLSSCFPYYVQDQLYRSVKGFEKVEILRYAYAIEYECIDPLALNSYLQYKEIKNLFLAGQVNGTSGYEEAASQGIIAGINASLYLQGKSLVALTRDQAYIGVLIDDLVTKGTDEPYRIMTSKAEYRLSLRQENADFRLTQLGRDVGLVSDKRYKIYQNRLKEYNKAMSLLDKTISPKVFKPLFKKKKEPFKNDGLSYRDMLKRQNITAKDIKESFEDFKNLSLRVLEEVQVEVCYEGYLKKQNKFLSDIKKLENKKLPGNLPYLKIEGIKTEAKEKLNKIKPLTLGQASRIPGVSPADITVLLFYLEKFLQKRG